MNLNEEQVIEKGELRNKEEKEKQVENLVKELVSASARISMSN